MTMAAIFHMGEGAMSGFGISNTCLTDVNLQNQGNCTFPVATDQHNPASRLRAFAGATFQFTIKGGCMVPALDDGQKAPVRESFLYMPGDIIVYKTDFGQILAHRLLGYYFRHGRLYFLTQADNAPGIDRGISRQQIIGKIRHPVSFRQRLFSLGRFLRYAGKWMMARAVR